MLNASLFASGAAARNAEGGAAYALAPREALAQLAMTGCLADVFYVEARAQLDELLAACAAVEPEFVARTAVYARRHGRMKDVPAVLLGWLAVHAPALAEAVFGRVIDDVAQLRRFVQVLRSGTLGKRSLASRPKRWVQAWLEAAPDALLVRGLVGKAPSLGDVIRLAHPRAGSVERSALYAHAIGREVRVELLPEPLQALARFRVDSSGPLPDVPFQLLTSLPLERSHWTAIAMSASWTTLRMNLAAFARHGVFEDTYVAATLAARLRDADTVRRARAYPYQLLAAWQAAAGVVPEVVREALREATEIAAGNVPRVDGSVAVAVDVWGSMQSPLTGVRRGASTAMRCVDVAGMTAACVLARNPGAMVLPFAEAVRPWSPPRGGGIVPTAQALARLLGGGTALSAPLARLNQLGFAPDVTIVVSDNQSWAEAQWNAGGTATEREWQRIRRRNPRARLVCIDLQPYANTPARDREGVLNVGGFGDAVFDVVAQFLRGESGRGLWVQAIEQVALQA